MRISLITNQKEAKVTACLMNRRTPRVIFCRGGGRLRHSPSEPTLHQPSPSSKVPPSIPPSHHNKSNNRSQLPPKARGDYYGSSNDLSPRRSSRTEPPMRKPLLPLGRIKTERSPPPPLPPRGSPRESGRKIPRKAMTVPHSPMSDTSDDSFSMLSINDKKHSSLDYVPMLADKPSGLDMEDFLPVSKPSHIFFFRWKSNRYLRRLNRQLKLRLIPFKILPHMEGPYLRPIHKKNLGVTGINLKI
jgi:hypothetical protein